MIITYHTYDTYVYYDFQILLTYSIIAKLGKFTYVRFFGKNLKIGGYIEVGGVREQNKLLSTYDMYMYTLSADGVEKKKRRKESS